MPLDGKKPLSDEEAVSMDVFQQRVTQDINEIKQRQTRSETDRAQMRDDIRDLQMSDKLQDKEIEGLKSTLSEIKDDTNFIRRRITGAVITATITAVIGGLIAIAVTFIYGG